MIYPCKGYGEHFDWCELGQLEASLRRRSVLRSDEDEIRRDERERIADMLLADIDAISAWATDRRRTVELIAFMVRPFDANSAAA